MAEQLLSVQVTGNNRCIVPWEVATVDPSSSFDDLLRSLKAGTVLCHPASFYRDPVIIKNVAS